MQGIGMNMSTVNPFIVKRPRKKNSGFKNRGIYAARYHFGERLLERFGIQLTDELYEQLNATPRFPDINRYIGTTDRHSTWWAIECQGQEILGLYDPRRACLLTCLPMSKLRRALHGHLSSARYLGLSGDFQHLWKYATKPDRVVPVQPINTALAIGYLIVLGAGYLTRKLKTG
jgi:hypothetical protein